MNEKDPTMEAVATPVSASYFHYAVIVSEFNSFITDRLLRGAIRTLESHQVPSSTLR
jgi:6,7-dimethyl-8-ribityllumazine synthase